MANNNIPTINNIFNDLDLLRAFCQEHGYRYDERDLYNSRSHVYKQFQRSRSGKPVTNQWDVDAANFKGQDTSRSN